MPIIIFGVGASQAFKKLGMHNLGKIGTYKVRLGYNPDITTYLLVCSSVSLFSFIVNIKMDIKVYYKEI